MNNNGMSTIDAFIALNMLDEDVADKREATKVTEGRAYSVNNTDDMQKAKEFVEDSKEEKDTQLEVVDADADTVKHLKNNVEYVGQMLLQCKSCKTTRFVNPEDLIESNSNADVYNVDDECPHCHATGIGYLLVGQVGKVKAEEAEEEIPEGETENTEDEASVETGTQDEPEQATFKLSDLDADGEKEPEEETDEQPDEDADVQFDDDEEKDFSETDAADDSEEVVTPKLGDTYDSDDVKYDDTEPEPEKKDDEEDASDKEDKPKKLGDKESDDDEKKKKEKKESLDEDINTESFTINEFIQKHFLDPEKIKKLMVVDNDTHQTLYEGDYEGIPYDLANQDVYYFSTGNGCLTIDVSDDEEGSCLKNILADYSDAENDNVSLCDCETSDNLFTGTPDKVVSGFGNKKVVRIENPQVLIIMVPNSCKAQEVETPEESAEDMLTNNIIKANNLSPYKIDNPKTTEGFIKESILSKEDLKQVYEGFVLPLDDKQLIKSFKDVTGYKDALDTLIESNGANIDLSRIKKVHPIKKIDSEAVVKVRTTSYKTRKDLAESINNLSKSHIKYKIQKSLKEGFRYDLIAEANELSRVNIDTHNGDIENLDGDSTTALSTMSDADRQIVAKLMRIANDIHDAINDSYHIDTDVRLILADLIQDLQLISGKVKVEDLPKTPINQLTAVMYQQYDGFNDFLDFLSDRQSSKAERLMRAISALDMPQFSKEGITNTINSNRFLSAARAGAVTFLNPSNLRLTESLKFNSVEETNEFFNLCNEIGIYTTVDLDNFKKENNCTDDTLLDTLRSYKKDLGKDFMIKESDDEPEDELFDCEIVNEQDDCSTHPADCTCEACKAKRKACKTCNETAEEGFDFDDDEFDKDVNAYINSHTNVDESLIYRTVSGSIEENGDIVIEGLIDAEDSFDNPVKFTLKKNVLAEGVNQPLEYTVTNDINDDVFTMVESSKEIQK